MPASHSTPVRLLRLPGEDQPRTPPPVQEQEEGSGVGITFSLPDGVTVDSGPVVAFVFPGSVADVDGQIRPGDILVSVDGESVRAWSMAKLRRVISGRAGARVSLELERGGQKLLVSLSRRAADGDRAAVGGGSSDNTFSQLSLSALRDSTAPSISKIGGGLNMVQVEQLHARCKVSPSRSSRPRDSPRQKLPPHSVPSDGHRCFSETSCIAHLHILLAANQAHIFPSLLQYRRLFHVMTSTGC